MGQPDEAGGKSGTIRYRLELEGELGAERADWLDAEMLLADGGRTVLEVEVADQAALYGLLRRVHDLHLRLVSLTRVDTNGTDN